MDNPHTGCIQIGRTERRIFDHPATIFTIDSEWITRRRTTELRFAAPEVFEWLTESVGEEWVDWVGIMENCHGGQPQNTVTIAFRSPVAAIYAMMKFGKIEPKLVYYEPFYSMMTKSGAPK